MRALIKTIMLFFFLLDTPVALAPPAKDIAIDVPIAWRLPPREIACLATILHYESRGEPIKGQAAVLQVVFTRMKKRKKNACQVMRERNQFSFYRQGIHYRVTTKMLDNYYSAANFGPAFKNEDLEYYHTTKVRPPWSKVFKKVGTINNHTFYQGKPNAPLHRENHRSN